MCALYSQKLHGESCQCFQTLAAMAQLLSRCSDKTLKSFHSVPDSFKKSSFMHCEKYLTDQLIAIGDNVEDFEGIFGFSCRFEFF